MSPGEKMRFAVLGFESTHDALDAEALLGDLGFAVVPIPVPAGLSAHCGIALRLLPEDIERALIYLARAEIDVAVQGEIEDV